MGVIQAAKRAALRLIPRRRTPTTEETPMAEETAPVPQDPIPVPEVEAPPPLTIEEMFQLAATNGSPEKLASFKEELLGTVAQVIDAKVTEAGSPDLPFAVEDRLPPNMYPVLVFGVGRSGRPGHWFEYRTKE